MLHELLRRERVLAVCALSLFLMSALAVHAATIDVKESQFPANTGRPGGVIASFGDAILVGGGLEGGSPTDACKVLQTDKEPQIAALPLPLAYAATVSFDGKVYLAGGFNGTACLSGVIQLSWDGETLTSIDLPSLPSAVSMSGLAVLDNYLYCFGGLLSVSPATAGSALYRLNLKDTDSGWETMDAFPGKPRIRPILVVRDSAIYVIGGQSIEKRTDGAVLAVALADCWEYRQKPLDGTTTRGWRQRSEMPLPLAGSAVCASGDAHVLLFGGFTGINPFSLDSTKSDASISDRILIFHTITDSWIVDGKLSAPKADGVAMDYAGETVLSFNVPSTASPFLTVEVLRTVKKLKLLDVIVIIAYFCGMALVGFYFSKKQNSSEEFALGNRNVKWWAAAVSMFATGASSFSFMAIPAMAFRTNLVWFTPVLMFLVFALLNCYFIYPLLRRLKLTSTYEYLESRFGKSLRMLASTQWLLAQLATMSVIMLLPAMAVSAVTGLNIFACVLVLGLLTTLYTSIGGFEAVIWTDFAQGVLMLLGPVIMIVLAIISLHGGWGEFVTTASEAGKFHLVITGIDLRLPIIWVLVVSVVYQNMAFVSQQHVIQRVYATPLKDARRLAICFAVIAVLISALVYFVGLAIFTYFKAFPTMMDPAMKTDQIVPLFIIQRLPTGVAGLLIAAIFAAAMSTLSSSMNSAATIFATDYYPLVKKKATDDQVLKVMKRGSLYAGLFGTVITLYMASMQIDSIFKTFNVFLALVGGGFIGIYILGMFTRRSNTPGVVVGALASIACVLYVQHFTSIHWMCYTPVAVTSCIVIGYLASLVLPHKQKDLSGLTIFDQLKTAEEES